MTDLRRLDPANSGPKLDSRVDRLLATRLNDLRCQRDRLFSWLLMAEGVIGIVIAVCATSLTRPGTLATSDPHIDLTAFVSALLLAPAVLLTRLRPGWAFTRHAVAVSQMLWVAVLTQLTGGRFETNCHILISILFLAFYRDPRVLVTASAVMILDHVARGLWWPESASGIGNAGSWRALQYGFWVSFEDAVLILGIYGVRQETRALVTQQVALEELNATIEQKVEERTHELASSHAQYRALVETTRTIPWQMAMPARRFTFVGPQAASLLGCSAEHWLDPGFLTERVHAGDQPLVYRLLRDTFARRNDAEWEFRLRRDDCEWIWVRCAAAHGESPDGRCLRGYLQDITERRKLQSDLQQSQKLEAVGRLAAGIAHEINTPIQYVGDSIHFIREGLVALLMLLERVREMHQRSGDSAARADLAAAEEDADLDYLRDRLPKAVSRSMEGLDRVATLVRAMKEFAHPDQTEQSAADLNRALESTLTIATNEYKYVATLETEFGELPPVTCHVNELNQAFLNIVVNAAHAIGDVVKGSDEKGVIHVVTRRDGEWAVIEISDTGGGIPPHVQPKIFEPFFTTKEVGKGTGQGLAIARNVVVEKHGGTLEFKSVRGRGTTFTFRLPIAGRGETAAKAA